MADEVVVLQDENGAYHLFDQDAWQQSTVPEDRVGDIEAMLGSEVQGFDAGQGPLDGFIKLGFMAVGDAGGALGSMMAEMKKAIPIQQKQ
jgi:hypothetical protein